MSYNGNVSKIKVSHSRCLSKWIQWARNRRQQQAQPSNILSCLLTSHHDVCHSQVFGYQGWTYSSDWCCSLGIVWSCPRTLIPSVATARSRMEPIASTESFSRTSTLHRLSSAAFTWKDGFSVVAPIRVNVPHSTWGRKVSYRYTHKLTMGGKKRDNNDYF